MSSSVTRVLAPICFFVYNRLWHTQQTVKALQSNVLAKESDLIIYSDGAKNANATAAVNELREYLKTIDGFKSVSIIEQSKNLGLANSIIDGVTKTVNQYGKVIVVEDDLVTSTHFLSYMNDALFYYKTSNDVGSIHGYAYPLAPQMPQDFFIYGADCWGWATWQDRWALFEPEGKMLLARLNDSGRRSAFDFNNQYGMTKMLEQQIAGNNDSWAIRWSASCFLANKLVLYPAMSFVQNIGLDDSGAHCNTSDDFQHEVLNEHYVSLKPVEVIHSKEGFDLIVRMFTHKKSSLFKRVKQKAQRYIKRLF